MCSARVPSESNQYSDIATLALRSSRGEREGCADQRDEAIILSPLGQPPLPPPRTHLKNQGPPVLGRGLLVFGAVTDHSRGQGRGLQALHWPPPERLGCGTGVGVSHGARAVEVSGAGLCCPLRPAGRLCVTRAAGERLWMWGDNHYGQLGMVHTIDLYAPRLLKTLPGRVAAVSLGGAHSAAIIGMVLHSMRQHKGDRMHTPSTPAPDTYPPPLPPPSGSGGRGGGANILVDVSDIV